MPVPVAVHRQRVDREHLIAGGHQGAYEQPTIGLDPDDHLLGLLSVLGEGLMQLRHTLDALRHPPLGEHRALRVQHADVVVTLGPVDPDEDHLPSPFPSVSTSLEECAAA